MKADPQSSLHCITEITSPNFKHFITNRSLIAQLETEIARKVHSFNETVINWILAGKLFIDSKIILIFQDL